MDDKYADRKQLEHNRLAAFQTAIHASEEEKARILQQDPLLMYVVDYYETIVSQRQGRAPEGIESELAEAIRQGDLEKFGSPQRSTMQPAHKVYDQQTGMLTGFDLEFGQGEKSLHVDLREYTPGNSSDKETMRRREDIFSMYQFGIMRNPEGAARTMQAIADKFPQGIVWHEPGHETGALKVTGKMIMQGTPSWKVITSQHYGQAFWKLHDQVYGYVLKHGDRWDRGSVQEAAEGKDVQSGAADGLPKAPEKDHLGNANGDHSRSTPDESCVPPRSHVPSAISVDGPALSQMTEVPRHGHDPDVTAQFRQPGTADLMLARLTSAFEQNGIGSQEDQLVIAQIKENIANRISRGLIPDIQQGEDVTDQLEIG